LAKHRQGFGMLFKLDQVHELATIRILGKNAWAQKCCFLFGLLKDLGIIDTWNPKQPFC